VNLPRNALLTSFGVRTLHPLMPITL
jgi:hypothetical protein